MRKKLTRKKFQKSIIVLGIIEILFAHSISNAYAERLASSEMYHSTCVKDNCVAVGETNHDSWRDPLAYYSKDRGKNWFTANFDRIPEKFYSHLNRVSCLDEFNCVAVGDSWRSYLSDSNISKFTGLIYATHNGGKTWTSMQHVGFPNNDADETYLTDVSCDHDACLAVGYHQNDRAAIAEPIAFQSLDKGISWSAMILPNISPTNFVKLNTVTCKDKKCLALGTYTDKKNKYYELPMSTSSIDGGLHWTKPTLLPSDTLPSQTSFKSTFILQRVTCKNNICLAAGTYSSTENDFYIKNYPIIYVSQDDGVSWKSPIVLSTLKDFPNGKINDVSCDGKNCVAAGFVSAVKDADEDVFDNIPVTYLSKDGGFTWSAPVELSLSTIQDIKGGNLKGISCDNLNCVVVGKYAKPYSPAYFTFAATSNNGMDWSLPKLMENPVK